MDTTFASTSVPRHLVRGVVGLVLIVTALALVAVWGPVTLLLLLPAGLALRGCPTCWALGLVQTRAACAVSPPGASSSRSTDRRSGRSPSPR